MFEGQDRDGTVRLGGSFLSLLSPQMNTGHVRPPCCTYQSVPCCRSALHQLVFKHKTLINDLRQGFTATAVRRFKSGASVNEVEPVAPVQPQIRTRTVMDGH